MRKLVVLSAILMTVSAWGYAAPEAISDLTAIANPTYNPNGTTDQQYVSLQWTVPSADGGNPTLYQVKWATAEINSTDFNSGWVNTYAQSWSSLPNGQKQSQVISGVYNLPGFTPGCTVYFAIEAVDGFGNGIWHSATETSGVYNTGESTCVPNYPPVQVQNLTSNRGAYTVNLQWTQNPESDIYGYNVYRSSYSSTSGYSLVTTVLSPVTSFPDSGLVNNNRYYYEISAVDNTGIEGSSSTYTSDLPLITNMSAPGFSADTVAISTTAINIAWNLQLNTTAYYRIINSSSGVVLADNLSSGTSFWIRSGLAANTTAQVYVQAFNGLETFNSAVCTASTFANPPLIFNETGVGTKYVNVSWNKNGNSPATRYVIQRSTDTSVYTQVAVLTDSATYRDTGLLEGGTYYYNISAQNGDGIQTLPVTPLSPPFIVTPRIAPSAPTLTAASGASDGMVQIQWTDSYDDGNDSTSGYCASFLIKIATCVITPASFNSIVTNQVGSNIVSISSSVATIQSPFGQTANFVNLYPGSTFWFAIEAVDAAGNVSSPPVVVSANSAHLPPPPPPSATAVPLSSTTIAVSWNYPVPAYNDLAAFNIYRTSTDFSTSFTTLGPINYNPAKSSDTFIDTSLSQKVTYYYQITSIDKGNDPSGYFFSYPYESLPGIFVSTKTLDMTPPAAVNNLSGTQIGILAGVVQLSWTSTGDDGMTGDINGGQYKIAYSTNSSTVFSTSTAQISISTSTPALSPNSYTVTGLTGGATYYFYLWTADASMNWSGVSNTTSTWAMVDRTPPAAITLNASSFKTAWRQVTITWNATGDDGYNGDLINAKFIIHTSTSTTMTPEFNTPIVISTSCTAGSTNYWTITGLTDGKTFYFQIFTMDAAGNLSSGSPGPINFPKTPTDNPPQSFTLASPPDGYVSPIGNPLLSWGTGAYDPDIVYGDSVTYTLIYSTDPAFTPGISIGPLTGTSYPVDLSVWEKFRIYWKVLATDLDGAQSTSNIRSVWINAVHSPPAAFNLVYPSTGIILTVSSPTVTWNASIDPNPGGAISYILYYSNIVTLSTYTEIDNIQTTYYAMPPLAENAHYYWKVYATDGISTTTCNSNSDFWINAINEPPTPFDLQAPANGTISASRDITFQWASPIPVDPDPGSSVTYNLVYSFFSDFSASTTITNAAGNAIPFFNDYTNVTAITIAVPYDDKQYYWKVDAVASNGMVTHSSEILMFYVNEFTQLPSTFSLVSPANGVVLSTTTPWFFWQPATDPDPEDTVRYYIDISNTPDFSGSQAIPTGTDTFYQPLSGLLDQTTYYWRVRASGYIGTPPVQHANGFVFSSTWTFAISMTNHPPQPFNLLYPQNNTQVTTEKPVLSWEKAVDIDLGDYAVYNVAIASCSDFSVVFASQVSLNTTSYALPVRLFENRNYWWKVTATDTKGAQTVANNVFMFNIPVLTKAVPPAGLHGTMSSDNNQFTLYWSSTVINTNGTLIDDLAGYNIYRSLSLNGFDYTYPVTNIPIGTQQWTDSTITGGKFYYVIRSVNLSGVESDNSMVLQTLTPEILCLLSSDNEIEVNLPQDVSKSLLASGNKWQKDLSITIANENNPYRADVLRSYGLKVVDNQLNAISNYEFSSPITLNWNYATTMQSAAKKSPSALTAGELQAYWNDGVEFIRIGGSMNTANNSLTLNVIKTGDLEMRQVARASQFGLASTESGKMFTPGVPPYDKMIFHVDNPTGDKVTCDVYDLKGEYVASFVPLGDPTATSVILQWDGNGSKKGVYIYQIKGEGMNINGTILLVR
jgi:hypothetical protein